MIEEVSLLSLPEGMRVEHIQITGEGLVIAIDASGFFPHLLLDCRGSNQIKDILSRSRDKTKVRRWCQVFQTRPEPEIQIRFIVLVVSHSNHIAATNAAVDFNERCPV